MTVQDLGAREARVDVAPGDVSHVCAGCGTGHPTGKDDDPRHVISGIPGPVQMATLPDGTQVPVQAPTDIAYHFDCHASRGCHDCAEKLAANGGSVKGRTPGGTISNLEVPDGHVDRIPGEFEERGDALVRVKTRAQAIKALNAERKDAGLASLDHEGDFALHADHAAAMAAERKG